VENDGKKGIYGENDGKKGEMWAKKKGKWQKGENEGKMGMHGKHDH